MNQQAIIDEQIEKLRSDINNIVCNSIENILKRRSIELFIIILLKPSTSIGGSLKDALSVTHNDCG
tara:strand:+ start:227 stop:424 length:198 start_codon:yes stop_codon:yes gene_type:complete